MGLISLTLPNDGETIDAADVNSPLNTIATAINGNLDNANIKTGAAIDGTKIADNSIPNTKMINAPLGWTAFANTPNTVTYNGNRNYDLVFNSVDLTSSLSQGMKLQLTRTVAAPDQCADLEAGSSQYFSKTSPAGMTFTDDFTVSAWVKLESYTGGLQMIISRQTASNGWSFFLDTVGRLQIQGVNASATDAVTSYAAVPLNKWVHVAGSLNMSSATGAVYFDGVEVASSYTNGAATALVQAGNLEVGTYNGGTSPFDGKLAQVAVFSSVLSAATIRSYMSQGLSGSESTLVSAFSLDNTLNDLNTTNANNLTANGGALATNADSPFANAVSAGLLEYAEINSVAFSTNTTVNVRVPDTCMIPTSGGVSAVSYSTQSNPYGLPYFSKVLGKVILNSSYTTQAVTWNQVPGASSTVYVPANATVRVSARAQSATNVTLGNSVFFGITNGTVGSATSLAVNVVAEDTFANQPAIVNAVTNPPAGSNTFNLAFWGDGAGTNKAIGGGVGSPIELVVELV